MEPYAGIPIHVNRDTAAAPNLTSMWVCIVWGQALTCMCNYGDVKLGAAAMCMQPCVPIYMNGTARTGMYGTPMHHNAGKYSSRTRVRLCTLM